VFFHYLFHLHQLRSNLYADRSKLRKQQCKKLRAMVRHTYENVHFYHRKFDEAGIKPDDVRSVDDLCKLPVTTKSEIQKIPLKSLISRNADVGSCVREMTSGSTGVPLTIVNDGAWRDFAGAVWARALLENGLRLQDRMAIVKNPRYFQKEKGLFRLLRRKHVSVFDSIDRQMRLLEDYRPHVIKGYPQSLVLLAAAKRDEGSSVDPRLIFTGGELLDRNHRELISSGFGCEVFDCFGCVEFGLLMWECREHAGYHMNVDGVVTEFLDNGDMVSPGERGAITCTGLNNFAMPLIRYELDDVGIPAEDPCPCGRSLPLAEALEGRVDDILTDVEGGVVYASSFFANLFTHWRGVRQFKVIQERRDKLTIQLILVEGAAVGDTVLEKAKAKIKRVFGEGMNLEFQILEKIDRDPSGKLRTVISHVPVGLARSNG